jgi:coniferyl-aldehyde dehydrogenase
MASPEAAIVGLRTLFARQREAASTPNVPVSIRIDRLQRAIDLLVTRQSELCIALASDFGQRPAAVTRSMDILPAVLSLKHARRHVRRWMQPQKVAIGWPFGLPGAHARICYQPLGVVGIISPWNFPLTLTFGPLAGALAAGNRCLIKPSEHTPALAELLQRLVSTTFDATEVAVVTGGVETAAAFASLPFDHLLFTGSTAVGRQVLTAAAAHLVPVTLELGGKCPVVLGRSADLRRAVDRILLAKLANAGQMCVAPDHVYLPAECFDAFIALAKRWVAEAYPAARLGADATGIINERQLQRVQSLLSDAAARGANLIPLIPPTAATSVRLVAPTLVIGATDSMRLMQEEIFAPILPLLSYERIDQVMERIAPARPLALYYFGSDRREQKRLLSHTRSGGMCINDVAAQFLIESLPFGGLGTSGMGAYHGVHGFRRFSHARAIVRQTPLNIGRWLGLQPPYGARLERVLALLLGR